MPTRPVFRHNRRAVLSGAAALAVSAYVPRVARAQALSASLSDYGMHWSAVVVVAILSAAGYAAVGRAEARVLAVYAPEQRAA